jgi:hypothetical protein
MRQRKLFAEDRWMDEWHIGGGGPFKHILLLYFFIIIKRVQHADLCCLCLTQLMVFNTCDNYSQEQNQWSKMKSLFSSRKPPKNNSLQVLLCYNLIGSGYCFQGVRCDIYNFEVPNVFSFSFPSSLRRIVLQSLRIMKPSICIVCKSVYLLPCIIGNQQKKN